MLELKMPKHELETVLDALKTSATLYGSARVTALTTGNADEYSKYNDKRMYAWQAYDHLKTVLEKADEKEYKFKSE